MLSNNISQHEKMSSKLKGFRVHFSSSGRLTLQSRVGSSSSSALTSAFVLGLNGLFQLGLDRAQMSETDFGEFYLGKTAGCADKTTILNSVERRLVLVASLPERFERAIELAQSVVVIMANSNIPRLNSVHARDYLSKTFDDGRVEAVMKWAGSVMRRFGSFVFVFSVDWLVKALEDEVRCDRAGISRREAEVVLLSLTGHKR